MNDTLATRGLVTAITTPFDASNNVDTGALESHVQCLWDNGCKHLLVSGTTGEFFSLTSVEKRKMLEVIRRSFHGTIMFHAGADCLADTVTLALAAQDAGADSIATLPPWYLTGIEEEGLIAWLEQVAEAVSLPFLIYNFPKHTRCDLSADLLRRVPHWGVKDSSANLQWISHTPRYFVGSDKLMLKSHRAGGIGFISARSNCEPSLYARIDDAILLGNESLADQLHLEILHVATALGGVNQISLIKRGVAAMLPGYPTAVRLPLLHAEETTHIDEKIHRSNHD